MQDIRCDNGHPVFPGEPFCAMCGAPMSAGGAAPPPVEPPPPAEASGPFPPPPPVEEPSPAPTPVQAGLPAAPAAGTQRTNRSLWIAAGVILAVTAAAVAVSLFAGGDGRGGGTGTTSADAITVPSFTTSTTPTSVTTTDPDGGTTEPSVTTTTGAGTVTAGDLPADGLWTVMVYAVGDNDLEAELLDDLKEMRSATRDNPALRFVVLADRADGYTSASLGSLGNWTTAKLLEISGGRFTEIDDWGEQNMGEAATLIRFIEEAVAHAPADHYGLIFWDHGSMVGIGPDESHDDDVLETWEIAAGLEAGQAGAGIDVIDIVGFDACLMGSLEVAAVVAPYARYMIASEDLEPGEGWSYEGFAYLATAAEPTMEGLGTAILEAYHDASSADWPTLTLSMLDLRLLPPFLEALDSFAGTALDTIDVSAAEIGRRRDRSVKFGSNPDPRNDWFMVDLGQLLLKTSRSDAPVAEEAALAARLLNEMVVANVTGEASKGARGLAVHFPSAPEWHHPQWYRAYGEPVWGAFLDAYFEAGRALPLERRAAFDRVAPDVEFGFDDYGLEVMAQIDPGSAANVVGAVLWSGERRADGTIVFYSADQGMVEQHIAIGFYDLTRLVMFDSVDEMVAFQQIEFDEELTVFTLTVPLQYEAPIDVENQLWASPIDLILRVTYDTQTEEFTMGLFYSDQGTIGAFTADPLGLLFPLLLERAPGGEPEWVRSPGLGLWADLASILYEFAELPSGAPLYSEFRIYDFGGYQDLAQIDTQVP